MGIAGIITEYDPLHYGHVYLMETVRQTCGADGVICVMSGGFTQRGEPAIVGRRARAAAAVQSGADLVLELPLPWAVSSAEGFARGGVETLLATGCVDVLAFGSECGDADALRSAARALEEPAFPVLLKQELARGDSFAAARQRALAILAGTEKAGLLAGPNDTLGVEYCRALLRAGASAEVFTVRRTGAAHDDPDGIAGYSASSIRALLRAGRREEALARMAPAMAEAYLAEEAAGRAPVLASACERAVLARLRSMSAVDFDALDTGREGLGRRLYHASRAAVSVAEVLDTAKTKRYAYARIRRMILWACLGLHPADVSDRVPYVRVLAADAKGRELLGRMRKTASVPVITKPADVRALGPEARKLFQLEARAADLYTLAYPDLTAARGGVLWRQGPVML